MTAQTKTPSRSPRKSAAKRAAPQRKDSAYYNKKKDSGRFDRYGGMALIRELLVAVQEKGRENSVVQAQGQNLAIAIAAHRSKQAKSTNEVRYLAQTMVRQAVGQGYLKPAGDRYGLTAKALKWVAPQVSHASGESNA